MVSITEFFGSREIHKKRVITKLNQIEKGGVMNLEMRRSKYRSLREFLENAPPHCNEIELTLRQIEIILRERLPESAYMFS